MENQVIIILIIIAIAVMGLFVVINLIKKNKEMNSELYTAQERINSLVANERHLKAKNSENSRLNSQLIDEISQKKVEIATLKSKLSTQKRISSYHKKKNKVLSVDFEKATVFGSKFIEGSDVFIKNNDCIIQGRIRSTTIISNVPEYCVIYKIDTKNGTLTIDEDEVFSDKRSAEAYYGRTI
jgi:hypothetical protein